MGTFCSSCVCCRAPWSPFASCPAWSSLLLPAMRCPSLPEYPCMFVSHILFFFDDHLFSLCDCDSCTFPCPPHDSNVQSSAGVIDCMYNIAFVERCKYSDVRCQLPSSNFVTDFYILFYAVHRWVDNRAANYRRRQ
jgi:hypothetical protein